PDTPGTAVGARTPDAQAVFSNSMTWNWTGNGTTALTETIASLNGGGYNTISMTPGAAGSILNFADAAAGLTRVNGGTFLFRGNNFGATPGAGNANLRFGNISAANLVGGGAAVGTGSTQVSILPFAIGG